MKQRTLEEQSRRGQAIARVLTDPDVREVFQELDEQYIAEWKNRDSTVEQRERVWYKSQTLHDLVEEFERAVNDGVFARETLQRGERQAP